MRIYFSKKKLSHLIGTILIGSTAVLAGCADDGSDGTDGTDGVDGINGTAGVTNYAPEGLKRLVTAPLGAEFTGMFLNTDGAFFINTQHPSDANTTTDTAGKIFDKGTVGVIADVDFGSLGDPAALDLPILVSDKELVKTAVGSYTVLVQQGDAVTTGQGTEIGDIVAADGTTVIKNSNDPDFNAAVSDGGSGFYLYTNWEDRPGSMSRAHMDSNYVVDEVGMLDFSSVNGTWVNCFGTLSPWGTPMSAEELYFDNTADWFDTSYRYFSNAQAMAEYLGHATDGSGANWPNPYDYGYIVEIGTGGTAADATLANVTVNKLELMGRFSHENSVVMPDLRTVFLSDDGSGTILFKFVADVANDMSAGTLYAAKATQTNGVTDPTEASFAVEWIELASGTENAIETAIRSFDGSLADGNYITDAEIQAYAESKLNQDLDGDSVVGTNPYADDRVGFLESRKAGAAMGATAEFRKMEGININFDLADTWWNAGAADGTQAYMYLAMSQFNSTMGDTEGDIQLDATNGSCGVVYRMTLVRNADGLVDIESLVPAIVGGPYYADRSVNECDVNNISNPDNLVVLDDGRVLIGEDTGNHENNAIWLFDDPAI